MSDNDTSQLRYGSVVVTLVSHLFRKFLVDKNLDTKEAETLRIRDFFMWSREYIEENQFIDLPLFPDKDELQECYNIQDSAFESVSRIFDDPFTLCERLHLWWPLLSLAGRRPLNNQIESIGISLEITFKDGHNVILPSHIGPQEEPYNEGMAFSLWKAQFDDAVNNLAAIGLDGIHTEHCIGEHVDDKLKVPENVPSIGGLHHE